MNCEIVIVEHYIVIKKKKKATTAYNITVAHTSFSEALEPLDSHALLMAL